MIVAGLAMARAAAPFLLSRTGLLTMAAVGVFVFYEGLPIGPLRMIPYVGPALERVTDGRVDRERKRGAAQERILWEEARRKLQAQREADRRAAQAEIDAVRLEYFNSRAMDAVTIATLRDEAAKAEADELDDAKACIPPARARERNERLRKQLNAIGR